MTTEAPAPTSASPLTRFRLLLARHARVLTVANIFTQGGIIVTGGAVRLTGSGLGCSTWPQCEPGTFTPQAHTALGIHPFIEFGNRTITFVLLIVATALAVAVWDTRRDLRWWGLVPLLGVVGQAILGGITVLAGLNPVVVAPHLLLSMGLVWQAVWLALRYRNAPRRDSRVCIKASLRVNTILLVGLLILGTVTTGAGPHSGDADATQRLGIDPALAARAHAMVVWAFVATLAYIVWRVHHDRSHGDHDEVRKAWMVLVGITLAQAASATSNTSPDYPNSLWAPTSQAQRL